MRGNDVKDLSREKQLSTISETRPPVDRNNIIATFHNMERIMDEMFERPFFGINLTPFHHMLQNVDGNYVRSIDMFEKGKDLVLKAELPGMKREDVSVKIMDNTIVISGEKRSEEKMDLKDFLRLERSFGTFTRKLLLPDGIDADNVTASFNDGVLEIRIPKLEGKSQVHNVTIH